MSRSLIILLPLLWCTIIQAQDAAVQTVVQTGHYENISALAYTPDGDYLLSASEDLTVKLWELETQREIRTFTGPQRYVKRIVVDPNGTRMITISEDKKLWIWNIKTGKEIRQLEDTLDVITNAIFSRDGKYIITGGSEFTGAVWDAETYQLVARLEGNGLGCGSGQCYVRLDATRDGKWLLAGVQNYEVEYWNLKTFTLEKTIKIKWGSCSSCTSRVITDPKSKYLITSTGDSLYRRDFSSGELIPFTTHLEDVEVMKLSSDGNYLGVIERGVFDMLTSEGRSLYTLGKYPDGVTTFTFSPKGKYIATAGGDKKIKIHSISNGEQKLTFTGYLSEQFDSLKGSVRYWVKNLKKQDISPDGKYILENIGGNAILWELESGRLIKKFGVNEKAIIASKFSPDGKYVATAGGDRMLRLWETSSGELIRTYKGQSGSIFTLDFSSDGKYLATGGWDQTILIWDIETGKRTGRYVPHKNGSPIEVRFAPGNIYLISGGLDKQLLLTDIDTGTGVREFIGHTSHVVSINFSPDGKYMLTGSWDSNAKLWDLSTGLAVKRFTQHTGPVYDVAFSPSGKLLATGSWDKTAKVWDASGKLLFDFIGSMGAVTSVNFTPDEKYLVSGSRDGSTTIWDLKTGKEVFSHIITSDNEWLVKSPSGDFYATDQARNAVYFVEGMKSYDIEQFFDEFYNPDVVKESFIDAGKTNDKLINSLKKSPPPQVEIISPKEYFTTKTKELELIYKVSNTGGGIDEIKITHNGKALILSDTTDKKRKKKARTLYKSITVDLVPGHNKFSVSAYSDGRIESRKKSIEVNLDGAQVKPVCYILAIGINEYQNPALNLNYARTDASGFAKIIRQKGKSLFQEVKLITLYDKEATKENIFKSINSIAEQAGPKDVFYMYYAGHGSMVDERFYFIPTEVVRLYESDVLDKTAISDTEMQNMLKQIKALKQVIILDACHSGGSTEILASRGGGEEKALAQLSRSAGVHVLAAAGSEQTATEFESLGHGLFTFLLLEALSGTADGAPKDGKVTVYELRSYIDNLVPEYSIKYKGSPQYPNTFSRGSDFPLVIVK